MNCLDFRRLVLVNPRQLEDGAQAHILECIACRDYLERQREMDAELFTAMQVPAPDGLADRVLVARGLAPGRRRQVWAIAASVLVAAAVGLMMRPLLGDALGREAIQHVIDEPESFTTMQQMGSEVLPNMLAEQGMVALRAVGQVTYSQLCPLDGRVARHLVVRTASGVVSLLLMPDDPKARSRQVTERSGYTAVTLPAGRGSILVVASTLEAAMAVEKSLARS